MFISFQKMTFVALFGHFWGTCGGNSLIIINDNNNTENKHYCTFHFNSKDDFCGTFRALFGDFC